MDDRVIEFIRGLRAAGVRISVAESQDALLATEIMGIRDREQFRESLRATLVKEVEDFRAFDELFPLYFSSGEPPLQNIFDDLNPDEQDMLRAALQALSGRLDQLLDWLTGGNAPSKEELERLAEMAGRRFAQSPEDARWITREMMRDLGFDQLQEKLSELVEALRAMGMSAEAIQKLLGVVEANQEMLEAYMAQQIGLQIARDRAERPAELYDTDLMGKSFDSLNEQEKLELRKELSRLVNQLRTRAALRRKRGQKGKFDAKTTVRHNQRFGGVPFELRWKKNKQKPSLVLLLDVSGSLRETVDFALRLIYELQDQVSKVRTFAFYADLAEITEIMNRIDPKTDDDIYTPVRLAVRGGPYQTDLGRGLEIFFDRYLNAVSQRSTVIVVGDGCNSFNPPRADLLQNLQRRAKRLIWFNTEDPWQRQDDSDMELYIPYCDAIYPVRNLRQLSSAVDKLLANG